jgi:hypothetical protein
MVTMRANAMIDVFDCIDWRQVAFLDFDLQRKIHLDSAFGSPLIGLPFAAALRQCEGVALEGLNDLRRRHHYGFFVQRDYRNKESRGVWNLDELMMAAALAYAENAGRQWFHVKPTGDTAPYYRRKYAAVRQPTSDAETVLSIPLGKARKSLPHVRRSGAAGRIRQLEVDIAPDPSWSPLPLRCDP